MISREACSSGTPDEIWASGATIDAILTNLVKQLSFYIVVRRKMATRAAAEDKARDLGSLYHQPTINPGLGSSRCPRCFSPIPSDSVTSGWTLAPVIRDTFSMVGTTAGGTLGAFHGFNQVMPFVQNRLRGPMWLHFLIGIPPIMLWSLTCATFGGIALPAFAQVSVSSYYAASAASHYTVSQLTRRIEGFATHHNHSRDEFSKQDESRP